jgi:hypothetical protein
MIAWTSPGLMVSDRPLRIGLSATVASPDAPFKADAQQLLRFHREFHRQLLSTSRAKPLTISATALPASSPRCMGIEQLIVADLAGGGLVLDLALGLRTSI